MKVRRILHRGLSAALLLLACLLSAGARADGGVPLPSGAYRVVAVRHSADVQAVAVPGAGVEFLGRRVIFDEGRLVWLDGRTCASWTVRETAAPVVILDDPNLSDVAIPPPDVPVPSADRRIDLSVALLCLDDGEETFGYFLIVDPRVLVMPAPGSTVNLILERPLSAARIRRLQKRLRSMKFHSGAITGRLDAATLRSLGDYAEYRGAGYRYARPAITANLLAGLGLIDAFAAE